MTICRYILTICSIVALAIVTFERNTVWIDDTSLWLDSARKSPNKRSPGHTAYIYYGMGREYADNGRYDEALAMLQKAIVIKPDYAKAFFQMGIVYDHKSMFIQSCDAFARAIEINPKYEDAYIYRGVIFARHGRYDEAIDDFTSAVRLNDRSDTAFRNLGSALYKKMRLRDAIKSYTSAIRLNPSFAEAYYDRGLSFRLAGNKERARRDFSKACELQYEKACETLSGG